MRSIEAIRSVVRLATVTLLLFQTSLGSAGVETNGSATNSSFLSLEQAVIVFNELSPLQLNLECATAVPPERIRVPITSARLEALASADDRQLRTLLAQAANYELIRSEYAYSLMPKPAPGGRPSLLDYVVTEFQAGPTNLFYALFALCKAVPFAIEFGHPIHVNRTNGPKLTHDYGHWPLSEIPTVSLAVTNATVRNILSALICPQKKAYWVARPLHEPAARLLGTNASSVVSVDVYHARESRHVRVPFAR